MPTRVGTGIPDTGQVCVTHRLGFSLLRSLTIGTKVNITMLPQEGGLEASVRLAHHWVPTEQSLAHRRWWGKAGCHPIKTSVPSTRKELLRNDNAAQCSIIHCSQRQCPTRDEWINKMRPIHRLLFSLMKRKKSCHRLQRGWTQRTLCQLK